MEAPVFPGPLWFQAMAVLMLAALMMLYVRMERAISVLVPFRLLVRKRPPAVIRLMLGERVREIWPQIAIIFATGQDRVPDLAGGSEAAFLKKPFGVDDIRDVIERIRTASLRARRNKAG
ncbi:hypothetical protein LJR030_001037 [Rhizobium sp. LjRoot30]|uniref:hypothetical protein n=1 Tax=Rhizobium sp. LjRoot30 TaxID=3342320 RepID=UPI003ECF6675